jgi:hypothetical protein
MLEWFRRLSAVRKFVVVWNLCFLPVFLAVSIYLVFFSEFQREVALAGVTAMTAAAALGLAVIWKVTK